MAVQYFYDQQIRRFLLQFSRMVSNFQVEFGTKDPNTNRLALQTVPVFYGDMSRQAATILKGNSENTLSAVPAMAFYISALVYDRQRVQDPSFIGKVQIREQKADPATGMLLGVQGDSYTVERPMPIPYVMTIKLDIWTSNTEQKLQLLEQITPLFNPSLEIQSTDNYVDWTSLTWVLLTDVAWTSRTVPVGQEDPIDVATLTFEVPIWLAPPARVTKMGVIHKVIANIFSDTGQLSQEVFDPYQAISRKIMTLLGYGINVVGNRIQLLQQNDPAKVDPDSYNRTGLILSATRQPWRAVINAYGTLNAGISQIRLQQPNGVEVIGTVAYDPTDETQLLFNIISDTLPVNTLPAINSVIDPFKVNVDQVLLDNAGNYKVATGTRFLILQPINSITNTEFAKAWTANGHPLVANANDIIEYDGTRWKVKFDSASNTTLQFVTNMTTGVQLRWDLEDHMWVKSYEGIYREDTWSIVL